MAYSCNKHTVTRETLPPPPKDHVYVVGRKHRCNHSWCPTCGPRTVRKALWAVRDWDYRRVRTLMVSIDRKLFPGGPAAALAELEKERCAFVRELNRRGAGIEAYVWFCEWHEDGFPHYHFLLLVEKTGAQGQIGRARIAEAWKYGAYVHENWIKSRDHWEAWVGYAAKTGYMHKDGAHQSKLPSWAASDVRRVRRTGGSTTRGKEGDRACGPEDLDDWAAGFGLNLRGEPVPSPPPKKNGRTNQEVMDGCGSQTGILLLTNIKGDAVDYGLSTEPYKDFASRPGVYLERYGWVVAMHKDYFCDYYKQTVSNSPNDEKKTGGAAGRATRAGKPTPLQAWADEYKREHSHGRTCR